MLNGQSDVDQGVSTRSITTSSIIKTVTAAPATRRTPIRCAIENGRFYNAATVLLRELGADATVLDNNGNSELHSAVMRKDALSLCKHLVEIGGVDVKLLTTTSSSMCTPSRTAREVATLFNHQEVAEYLKGETA